jgi:PAS domain S-box-containing protein
MTKRFVSARIGTLLSFSVGLMYVVVALTVVVLVNYTMRQQALTEAESKARVLLDRNMATHTYFSEVMKPDLLAWSAPFRSDDYFDPSWMSSTYAVRQIDKYFKALSPADYYYKDAAINARSPENEADAYEVAFLDELRVDPALEVRSDVRTIDGKPYFVVLRPGEVMEESCLLCHGDPAQAPGDLVRVYGPVRGFHRESDLGTVISTVSIRVPLAAAYSEANRFSMRLSALLLAALAGLFVAQSWLHNRLLFAPLTTMRDKARQISTGSEHLGEEIPVPFGQELGELASAFNAMSVNLRQNRDQLEERVEERTADLFASNEQLGREITVRQQVEEKLRSERDLAESLIETAPAIVLLLDTEGRIVRFNPYMTELSGYRLEEVQGKDWIGAFLPERERDRIRRLFSKASSGVQTRGNINPIVTRDGRERVIEWYDKALKDAQGNVVGLLAIGQDISERVQTEQELQRLFEQTRRDAETKATLLQEINHRVKNNLASIIGLLYAEQRHAEAEDQAAHRSVIGKLINRVSGLATVHALLSASEWAPLNLSDLAGQVIRSSLQILSPDQQVYIDVLPSPVLVTPAQAHNLALVVNELATNSFKYALQGRDVGRIAVRVAREDHTVRLEFRDDGPGYPEEVLGLERNGVGFDLVQNIVRSNLGGELSLHNDGGAVAVIRFAAQEEGISE